MVKAIMAMNTQVQSTRWRAPSAISMIVEHYIASAPGKVMVAASDHAVQPRVMPGWVGGGINEVCRARTFNPGCVFRGGCGREHMVNIMQSETSALPIGAAGGIGAQLRDVISYSRRRR